MLLIFMLESVVRIQLVGVNYCLYSTYWSSWPWPL